MINTWRIKAATHSWKNNSNNNKKGHCITVQTNLAIFLHRFKIRYFCYILYLKKWNALIDFFLYCRSHCAPGPVVGDRIKFHVLLPSRCVENWTIKAHLPLSGFHLHCCKSPLACLTGTSSLRTNRFNPCGLCRMRVVARDSDGMVHKLFPQLFAENECLLWNSSQNMPRYICNKSFILEWIFQKVKN